MSHHHDHHHHTPEISHVSRAFVIGIVLNLLFVLIEAAVGFKTNSLALLSDAGHNLTDVVSLVLALLAIRLAKIKSTDHYSYGFQKTTILAALINAVILLVAIGAIVWEAYQRLNHPAEVAGKVVSIVAFIGIIINSVTALLFFRDKDNDINVKGAYLHLAADAGVSLVVVIGGVLIFFTKLYWIDSLLSFVVAIVIFIGTWRLLKETIRLSLDGVPHNVEMDEIIRKVEAVEGVVSVHHVHVWAISTTKNAMTAHIILDSRLPESEIREVKCYIKKALMEYNIHHATLETERENDECDGHEC